MSGVLAVVGLDGAEAVVRRGARPMLRRPWQRLEVAATADDRVAIGLAGERGGVVTDASTGVLLAFDGELWTDDGVVPDPAKHVLASYLEHGAALQVPDGFFAAAIWDPRIRTLVLLTDSVGSRPLFLTRQGRAILVAAELKALIRAGLTPELDIDGWSQLLAYEFLLGGSTPLAGVRILPPGATVAISESGTERVTERWRYRLEPADRGDAVELEEELGRLLGRAFARRDGDRLVLALSGGLDSRCLTTVATPGTVAATFGMPGSEELELGRRVAAGASIPHRSLEFERGYVARNAAATVWLTEGQIRCFHSHHLALGSLRASDGLERLVIGFGGDPVMRWGVVPLPTSEPALVDALHADLAEALPDPVADELLTARFAAALRGRARSALATALADETGDPVARRNQLCFRQSYRRKVLPGAELFADDLAPRDPYTDAELIDFCRRMPHALRTDGNLQRSYLRRHPAVAHVRNPKDGVAPSLVGARRAVALQMVQARRRTRKLAETTLRPVRWRRRGGLGDYSTDLRRAGSDRLGILLEPRTLGRGQLREEPVRRLIAATLAGRRTDTQALGMLLTLELFQRQFLEGDEPPELGYDWPAADDT